MKIHDVQSCKFWYGYHEEGRHNGKVFRHIVGDGEGGECATCHEQLLANLNDLNELCRVVVKIYHITSLLGRLSTAVHGHTHVGLCQCWSIVGAVAHHGNEFAVLLLCFNIVHFVFWLSLGNEIIHSSFLCDIFGSQWIVTSHHNCLHTHLMQTLKTLTDSLFNYVL